MKAKRDQIDTIARVMQATPEMWAVLAQPPTKVDLTVIPVLLLKLFYEGNPNVVGILILNPKYGFQPN